MTAAQTPPGVYSRALYVTSGQAFSRGTVQPAQVKLTQVGSGTHACSDRNDGTFAYTVNGIAQTKAITLRCSRR